MFAIVDYAVLSTEEEGESILLSSVLYIITSIIILCLMNYDRLKGVYSSGLLFVFWLLVSLTIIPDLIIYSVQFHHQVSYLDQNISDR